jgi:hypothetical protein
LVCGLVPFVVLLVVAAGRTPGAPDAAFWTAVLVGTPRNADLILGSGRDLLPSLLYVGRWTIFCFPGVALPLAAWGLLSYGRRNRAVVGSVAALGALSLVLPLRMGGVGDRYVFLAGTYPVIAIGIGLGLEAVRSRFGRVPALVAAAVCVMVPPVLYASLALTAAGPRLLPALTPGAAQDFFLPVRTGDPGSREWSQEVSRIVGGEPRVFAEWGAASALEYGQAFEGCAPGVDVVRHMPSREDLRAASGRGVVVVLTPIWSDERRRVGRLPGRAERLAPSIYRLRAGD